MNFKYFIISILFVSSALFSEAQEKAYEVVYHRYNNQKLDSGYSFSLKYKNHITYLSDTADKIQAFIDYNRNAIVDIINYKEKKYKTLEIFDSLPKAQESSETDTILGYICHKVVYSAFSNSIEIWYTTDAPAKGSPYKSYLPKNALAMQIIINGGRKLLATEINEFTDERLLSYPFEEAQEISKAEYRELQIKSRYVSINVFDKQQINFESDIKNPAYGMLDSVYRFANGTIILKKIKLPEINKEGAIIYASLTNWSHGDAYDRTASLFTFSTQKEVSILDALEKGIDVLPSFQDHNGTVYKGYVSTDNYDVPIELMRFFTSFGVSHFNHKREINNYKWDDSVFYKEEITKLIPNTEDEIWIGVYIGNYDKGGHYVSLNLDFYPGWEEDIKEKWIKPLFNTVTIMEAAGQGYSRLFNNDTLRVDFSIPENIKDLQLIFTTTGHGGWGNGDEFVQKLNQIFIDGECVFKHIPWRTDCARYRMSNPASGNFGNGMSSSDLSRSNWCPATATPPFFIPLDNIKAGNHHIEVVIDQGEDEGSSFSHWQVSGILSGTKKPDTTTE